MKKTMLAGLISKKNKYEIKKIDVPKMFEGSALVKVKTCGICGTDTHNFFDSSNNKHSHVKPVGHELSGQIEELPKKYNGSLKIGDRVAVNMSAGKSCGNCFYCYSGYTRHCLKQSIDTGGGFAQYVTRNPLGLYRISDDMSWNDGALVEPLAIAVHGLRYSSFKSGMNIAIVGSGTIGLSTIVAAKFFGASKIIASAKYPHQADAAKKMGADIVVNTSVGELENACMEQTKGMGVDIAVETVGGIQNNTIVQASNCVKPVSNVLILGIFSKPILIDLMDPMLKEINYINTTSYAIINGISDFQLAIDILSSGNHPFSSIVSHKFTLKDIHIAFEKAYYKKNNSLKVHIEI